MEHVSTREVISTLNSLIAICKDGEKGYRTAANVVADDDYRALFGNYALQRGEFATELQMAVTRMGGHPVKEGDIVGTLHRRWMNLKAFLANGSADLLIAECEMGEEAALEVYEEARRKNLREDIYAIVDRQYQAIKAARDRIRALEKANGRPS